MKQHENNFFRKKQPRAPRFALTINFNECSSANEATSTRKSGSEKSENVPHFGVTSRKLAGFTEVSCQGLRNYIQYFAPLNSQQTVDGEEGKHSAAEVSTTFSCSSSHKYEKEFSYLERRSLKLI